MKYFAQRSIIVTAVALAMQFGYVSGAFAAVSREQGSTHGQPFLTLQDQIDVLSAEADKKAAAAAVDIAEAALADTKRDLSYTKITTPTSGSPRTSQ